MEEIKITNLLDLNETIARGIFENYNYPWEVLTKIGNFIIELGENLNKERFDKIDENIWISKSAKISPTSYIEGPCIIDENAQIRHSAYIRGNVIIGKETVVRKFN